MRSRGSAGKPGPELCEELRRYDLEFTQRVTGGNWFLPYLTKEQQYATKAKAQRKAIDAGAHQSFSRFWGPRPRT